MSVKVDWDIKEIVQFRNRPEEVSLEELGWNAVSKDYKRVFYHDGYLIGFDLGAGTIDVVDEKVKVEEGVHGVTIVVLRFSNVIYHRIESKKRWLEYDVHANKVGLTDNPEKNIMESGNRFGCPIIRRNYISGLVRKEIARREEK